MVWDWLVRRVRVEVALWQTYWWARLFHDRYNERYCAKHSVLIQALGRLQFIAVLIVSLVIFSLALEGLWFFTRDLQYWLR